jgi:TATA-binding protein-associated factor
MPQRSVIYVHDLLLQMIQQNFSLPSTEQGGYIWEVRHAGLLGIKYEVAVRHDLFDETLVKDEATGDNAGKAILKDVVDAAILGYVADRLQRH